MKVTTIAYAILLSFATLIPLNAAEETETIKIVYQCDFPEAKRVELMLNTLNNLVKHYQENLIDFEIDVVALGPCLQYMMKDFKETGFVRMPYLTEAQSRFKSLVSGRDNIKLFACENTMQKKNVKPEQLIDEAIRTPAGIVKVIDDQLKGYAYIKIK